MEDVLKVKKATAGGSKDFLKLQTICYVCGKEIRDRDVCIGKGLYRHTSCEPGSSRWLKSSVSKRSCVRDCFLQQPKKEEQKEEV